MILEPCRQALTDEDLEKLSGQRDQPASALRTRYSLSLEEAKQAIATFEKDVRFPGAVK